MSTNECHQEDLFVRTTYKSITMVSEEIRKVVSL